MAAGARAVPGRPTQPSVLQSFLTRPRTQPGGHERPCHARQPRPQAAGPAAGASVRRTRTGVCQPAVPHRRSPRVPNTAHAATRTGREEVARPPGMPGQTQLPGRASRRREPGRAASHRRWQRVLRAPSPERGGGGAACGLAAGTDGQRTCPAPRQRGAGTWPLLGRPDPRLSVPPLLPGWPSVVLSFGEFPPAPCRGVKSAAALPSGLTCSSQGLCVCPSHGPLYAPSPRGGTGV
nr:dapper homolog 3-like [Macaca nemestrina]XP_011764998.1 dapper homolog 3-like [Macaca nemestrina]XP_011764999.1 dapper homolog 3-like [Macaca nemestrina]XP_011765001.1 dapper homolog 3-like [Macaca nemestrina]XP_011765002.1 dapper homolog 3-like [Macaca nemestrina]XP_011765003.1 dapper homolog 3-like [Macaca nemestrina]XP_011765004.1 dapper homolog 3-like [Macaca nemestrina]XP_011765005.1 dapper homolog 3-like [Macaca nemestrina]